MLGDQDEAGDVVNHDNFGDAVGVDSGVIDQPAKPSTLACGVNTNKILDFNSHLTFKYLDCLPILLSLMFEVIHVAALGGVHGVPGLEIFGSSYVN